MKKIAVFSETNSSNYSIRRLLQEAQSLNLLLDHLRYSNLHIELATNCVNIYCNDLSILDEYTHFIFRSSKKKTGEYFGHYTGIIKNLIHTKDKKALNDDFALNFNKNFATKLNNYAILAKHSVPIVKSYNFASIEQLENARDLLEYPLIAKKSRGSHGKNVHIINSFNELLHLFKKEDISMYLIQDFIRTNSENQEDYRVLTLGQQVLGVYKKKAASGSITTNLGSGGTAEKVEMSNLFYDIGQKVINATGMEFSGIDLIFDSKQNPYVLEVNSAPQFQGFEKVTGVNVAKLILEFLINK